MSEIERIINEVDSSMSMEGLPLTDADKERISVCLNNPKMLDSMKTVTVIKSTLCLKGLL